MKIKCLIISVLFIITLNIGIFGQSYYYHKTKGTDLDEYRYNILGTVLLQGDSSGIDDVLSLWQVLPFDWYFYGKKVDGYYASDNGYITFDQSANTSIPNNTTLPNSAAPDNSIFAFWDSLELIEIYAGSHYLVHSWTDGSAPNRVHVIHWFNIHTEGHTSITDASLFFGIRLYESGDINFDVVFDFEFVQQGGSSTPTSATIGIQNSDGSEALMAYGTPSITFPQGLLPDYDDDLVYEFYYGIQPTYDMLIAELNIVKVAKVNTSVNIEGIISNFGSETVTSFDLNYTVNNDSTFTSTINSVSIPSGETYKFTHPNIWTAPSTDGDYNITVWASDINGNTDENPLNDSLEMTVKVVENYVQRIPLHEVFTSSTNSSCFNANINLRNVLDNNIDKYTLIKYQMNFPVPGDPYYITDGGFRKEYYDIDTTIPIMKVDGEDNPDPLVYTQYLFDNYYQVPSFLDITATHLISGRKIDIDVTVHPYINILNDNLKAHIAIVENKTFNNIIPGYSNGETEFYNVLKKMVPSPTGTFTGPLTKGIDWSFKESYTFPADNTVEEFSDLSVIVFVQDNNTKHVLQSAWSTGTNAIKEPDKTDNLILGLFPNPCKDIIHLDFNISANANVKLDIYNSLGQKMLSQSEKLYTIGSHNIDLDISDLVKGAYIVKLQIDDQLSTAKFIK